MKIKISKSAKKFIRQEKARIRKEISDFKGQKEAIEKIYQLFLKKEKTDKK